MFNARSFYRRRRFRRLPFTTAARLSGWQTATTDNRPNYFALGLKGNALHFYTTLTVAQQQNFDQLVAAFRNTYTTNVEVLKAKLKAARPQPNQTIVAFLWNVQTPARRVYGGQPLIKEQMVLTNFIEVLHDAQLRWELRKSKPASPDAALALAVELHAFMEMDPSLRSGSQATVNMVSASPPQTLMAKASTSQEDMVETLIQTIRQEIQKALPKQVKTLRIHVQVVQTVVLTVPEQPDKVQFQIKIKIIEIQTTIATDTTFLIRTIDTTTVAFSETTDTTIIAIHQINNKTEITQTNNNVDLVTERIINPGIVRPVLLAED